jgi:hypothetical protein
MVGGLCGCGFCLVRSLSSHNTLLVLVYGRLPLRDDLPLAFLKYFRTVVVEPSPKEAEMLAKIKTVLQEAGGVNS